MEALISPSTMTRLLSYGRGVDLSSFVAIAGALGLDVRLVPFGEPSR